MLISSLPDWSIDQSAQNQILPVEMDCRYISREELEDPHVQEVVQRLQETVYRSATRAQNHIIEFHGQRSTRPDSGLFETFQNEHWPPDPNEEVVRRCIPKGLHLRLTHHPFGPQTSYIFNELEDNTVVIDDPINHLLIRRCDQTNVELMRKAISGVEILFGKNISIVVPNHNWLGVETTNHAEVSGGVSEQTRIMVYNSLDIRFNHYPLPVNPFNRLDLTWGHTRSVPVDRGIDMSHSLTLTKE